MSRVGTLLLSGGRSSRMGRAKALLPLGGTTFVAHAVDLFGALGPVRIMANPQAAPLIEREVVGVPVWVNPHPEQGLFSSVWLGAAKLAGELDGLFILPVDCVLPDAAVPGAMLAALEAARQVRAPEPAFAVPVHAGRRGHPVLLNRAAVQRLGTFAPTDVFRVVLEAFAALEVPVDEPFVLGNINTPEEYNTFLAQARERRLVP